MPGVTDKEERTAFAEERRDYVEKLMTFNCKVGELETKLLQLGAARPPESEAATPLA